MTEYKNILFDLDMTLLDFDRGEFNALRKTFFDYGIEIDEKKHAMYSEINKSLWKRYEKDEIDKEKLAYIRFSTFLEYIGLDKDPRVIDKQYKDNLSNEAILMDGVFDTCRKLYKNYSLYIITNGTDYIQRSRIAKSGIEGLFEAAVTSDEAGAPKPKKEFFDYFFAKTGIKPDESLIVGDSPTSDILGGVNYSLDTCFIGDRKALGDIEATYVINIITELLTLLN
jgi:2-haloacid dehalogenase